MRRSKSHHSITPPGRMACDALTAVARCFVLSLDSEQVVTKKAVRLHCHSVPSSGSDTACGRPTATAAPAATIATAAIASVLDLCQMNLMAFSDLRGLKSALCRHDSLRASSPLRNRTTGTSLHRTSAPLAPVTMSDSGPCRVLTSAPSARSTAGLRITRSPRFTPALTKTSRPRSRTTPILRRCTTPFSGASGFSKRVTAATHHFKKTSCHTLSRLHYNRHTMVLFAMMTTISGSSRPAETDRRR